MVDQAVRQSLQQVFGFDSLRNGQEEVVTHILQGHSSAAIFPTGSGKSLCYQLPALHLPHLTLVISPLLALIKDQLQFLKSKGIAAESIDSTQDRETSQRIMQSVRNGTTKILMISVERLKNERFRQFISQVPISMLVVDEAHCISEWGHNFRPDYLKLPQYQKSLNIPQVLLLTATATPKVIADMQSKFNIQREHITVTGFYRSNLRLDIQPCLQSERLDKLTNILHSQPDSPTIVYVTLQNSAEQVANYLREYGINALAYHAGLKSEDRECIQHDFMTGAVPCIVATIAFGMGVDKSDIRRVIHFDLPKSIENYSQEIGRAGRDGQHSDCILLGDKSGLTVLENFVYGDTPDANAIQLVIEQIYQTGSEWSIILNRLSKESNIRQLPLKTLLVYLELQGVIEPRFSYFADYRFKLNMEQQQICARFQGERKQFVEAIFQCSPKAKTWHTLDFDALWQGYSAERSRVVSALDYFHENGWIELESKQATDVYRVLNTQSAPNELAHQMHSLFEQKEQSEVERIRTMVALFEESRCLSYQLASYFADENAPAECGHCSVCEGRVAQLPGAEPIPVDSTNIEHWIAPYLKATRGSATPQALARFLCGIATPESTSVKARQMEGFAKFESTPFSEVLNHVKQSL
ncbi:putative ATP-dependent DNA helicase recQ [Vibrio nigripulchritudo MADA3029]|uniref:RecQ family ATP-dependent DNA helicase n=1 Tax=Vibrio nigripulchritudo TaxID=28173 RepID=UPI0003B19E29|nr:RecQ family ATP-dependent DNA helicase [Vibrio nigripulchritudo]CCN47072.1 putative ATP-dependent DNA helicase recQ [Vibrio nigripulchritudo MADA3020]CCN51015.1 putative ATP-dependent DNA helicase recQ [Vibrio nigripulchritudo MADA3021]CCN60533.1 putative ATP-dependent DNA helicase recQ [Vibrio nigripulchritudo MADA3029]